MGAAVVAAAISRAERRLVRELHESGARSAATAQPLPELRRIERSRLEHLRDAGAIQEAAPGRYFVDDGAYAAYRGDRRATVLALVVLVLGAGALFGIVRP